MRAEETGVLIIGGGLAGLSTAAFLGHAGVRAVLVERHETTSSHPRARGVNARTMELLDVLGVAGRARGTDSARALAGNRGIRAVETLAGQEFGELHAPYFVDTHVDISDITPQHWCLVDQDELEPVLAQRAAELGADLRFATELVGLEESGDGMLATVLDRSTGTERRIRARYVVAADGSASALRQRLGIGMAGPGSLAHYLNIHFRADLREALGDRRFILSYVVNSDVMGAFVPIDNAENWLLHVMFDPASGQRREDFPDQRCVELVRIATGVPDLDVKIQSVLAWEAAGRSAESYRSGRVFLVGDAAHVMPPTGAFGSNTGIQDAHNLAWKLAAVLTGQAGEALLDSYDAERRPVAAATVEQAVLRSKDRPVLLGEEFESSEDILPDRVVHFCYRYRSGAVADDGAADESPEPWAASCDGQPGTRAPHAPVTGAASSMIDLYTGGWVLVAGAAAAQWADTAPQVAADLGVPLAAHRIGDDVVLTDTGPDAPYADPQAVTLVRPDGFVAWRGTAAAIDTPAATLRRVLADLLGR